MEKLIQKDSQRGRLSCGKENGKKWRKNRGFVLCTIIEREHSAACDSSSSLIISSSLPRYLRPSNPHPSDATTHRGHAPFRKQPSAEQIIYPPRSSQISISSPIFSVNRNWKHVIYTFYICDLRTSQQPNLHFLPDIFG